MTTHFEHNKRFQSLGQVQVTLLFGQISRGLTVLVGGHHFYANAQKYLQRQTEVERTRQGIKSMAGLHSHILSTRTRQHSEAECFLPVEEGTHSV